MELNGVILLVVVTIVSYLDNAVKIGIIQDGIVLCVFVVLVMTNSLQELQVMYFLIIVVIAKKVHHPDIQQDLLVHPQALAVINVLVI